MNTMTYTNYSNGNPPSQVQPLQYDGDGFPIGICIKKAMTKVRDDLYGNGKNRGILIAHQRTQQERWVSVPADDPVCQVSTGKQIIFNGKGQRPSLSLMPTYDSTINQSTADHFARRAEQSWGGQVRDSQHRQPTQNEIDYNEHLYQSSPPSVADDGSELAADDCHLMAGIFVMLRDSLPDVSEESIVKMAVTIYIQQSK